MSELVVLALVAMVLGAGAGALVAVLIGRAQRRDLQHALAAHMIEHRQSMQAMIEAAKSSRRATPVQTDPEADRPHVVTRL